MMVLLVRGSIENRTDRSHKLKSKFFQLLLNFYYNLAVDLFRKNITQKILDGMF